MPNLRAFRALRYDPLAVPDAGTVLCPPYDVIDPAERQSLAARDPRNAVHVELPVQAGQGDRYQAAARIFSAWRSDGTLKRDARPCVYPYEQTFRVAGAEHVARGFFCRLGLEDFGLTSGVRPHERTMGPAREDRYRLLTAVGVNLSPVLLLYEAGSDDRSSTDLLRVLMSDRAEVDTTDLAGARHRLWAADPATDPVAGALLELAAGNPLTIADGHHRYETALRFRDERRRDTGGGGEGPHEYVLALLFDAHAGGLEVLPTHRVLRDAGGDDLLRRAGELFDVVPVNDMAGILAGVDRPGRLGVWTSDGGTLLTADRQKLEPVLAPQVSEALRWLDVTVLDAALETLTGTPANELVEGNGLYYTHDGEQAMSEVSAGRAAAAFLLPPTPIQTVLDVAAAGEVMPQKSTYFQPKAATGLLFNPVVE